MTHLELFAGIGGIGLAAEWAGFTTIAMVERDPFCQKVLAKNFPGVPIYDDITTFDGTGFRGRTTLVSAGFPCQPHSVAGKRKASGDERDLWGEVVRVLGEAKPEWFLGENVPGLLSSESGAFFGRVINDLAALGYRVGWGVWGACDVGAVHRRNRVFIVAYADSCESGEVDRDNAEVRRVQEAKREPEHGSSVPRGNRPADAPNASRPGFGEFDTPTKSSGAGHVTGRDVARATPNPSSVRRKGLCESRPIGQDHEERESGRACESEREVPLPCDAGCGGLSGKPRRRSGEKPTHGYTRIQGGDWRAWDVKPVFRGSNDGVPPHMVRDRIPILRALGNAVVPQQCFPILQAIAATLGETGDTGETQI